MTKAVHLTVEGIARTKLPAKGMRWLSDTDGGRGSGRLYARIQHLEHGIFISVIQLPQANGSPAR